MAVENSWGYRMLVSSIGYFKANNSPYYVENAEKNQQSKSVSLTEGFGHYNDSPISYNQNSSFMKNFVNSFRSMFSIDKAEDSSKYLSLIA